MNNVTLNLLKKEIPYRWKQNTGKAGDKKGSVVAYIDARDAMNLLDEVCGQGNWKDDYVVIRDDQKSFLVQSTISIKIGDEWVSKNDLGSDSSTDPEKGAYSDAFKRAGVKWGIGRFLYDLDIKWVNLDANGKPVDEKGNRIYDMTEYINSLNEKPANTDQSQKTCTECGVPVTGTFKKCYDCNKKK